MVVFDNNNDDLWPAQPGDEGLYQLLADGSAMFLPYYADGKQGNYDMSPAGVEVAFGMAVGQRVVEMSFDFSESHLKVNQGGSLGMYLIYFDQDGADYPVVGIWPPTGTALEACEFFGTVDLGLPSDAISVDPSSLTFAGSAGGALTAAQTLAIDATTQDPLDLTFQASDAWIQLSAATGTSPMTLDVQADPAALEIGTHQGSITIIAPQAQNSPLEIPVTFEVAEPAPVFSIDPPSLSFSMDEDGQLPQGENLTITNTGGGTLDWTALPAGDWYTLSPTAGTAPSTVTVTPATALPPGSHTSLILFTAEGAQPAQAAVSITVTAEDQGGSSGCGTVPGTGLLPILLLLFAGLRTYFKRQWTSS
jgi:uncharacterized protein (TIGR03382 family)